MEPGEWRRNGCGRMAAAALTAAWFAMSGLDGGRAIAAPEIALQRAEALIQARDFNQAAAVLKSVISADPKNRWAREMLAFALESAGDLAGERRVRAALAADYPDDAGVQAAYGRVLERSGKESEALATYRRAQALSSGRPDAELEAAIERMEGRTSVEAGAPVVVRSDPDANASRFQAGVAIPLGPMRRLALLAARESSESRIGSGTTDADQLAASLVLRSRSGASLLVGPRLHRISRQNGAPDDTAAGGVLSGRTPLGPWLEFQAGGGIETPWDEAPITVLHGGRTTGAEGHLYAHLLERRLLLQVGAQRRRLSVLTADPLSTSRPEADQFLRIGGADWVVWRKPGAAIRGEMLDDSLAAPGTLASAITVGYRHYELETTSTPEFDAVIALVPRGVVDEASTTMALASPRGRLGMEFQAGLGRDSIRDARLQRFGGALLWAPGAAVRFRMAYEEATDITTGLSGTRRTGTVGIHVAF